MGKFKAGDKVRVVNADPEFRGIKNGDIKTVLGCSDNLVKVETPGHFKGVQNYYASRFELVEDAPSTGEKDPNGTDPHSPGAKLDAGKVEFGLILHGMPRALRQVARVATYGANKYTRDGWLSVPDGPRRYTDAMYRHLNAEATGELHDADTQLEHAAHAAWNALARLELLLRGQGQA